ncbi:WAT1-related protein At5g40240-like isoform X2 [Trifolium pratense]|uniref:WAT1-related protein At5g40240-like isoform X2 n=1 Tax=Trifolium pratense TaxID=57577 RepID=UPI001E69238E|nr:WAT1-related protein At5g40240-like isoform X2 [Trifolium pratense]
MDRTYCYKDLLPFVILVVNECMTTGVNTLFKAATLQGMSKYVFVTYSYTFATIFFFPVYFFYRRSRVVPQLSFNILFKIAILAVIGMEKLAIKRRTTQAKIWGSIISISGAFIVTFYKGKSIVIAHNSPSFHMQLSNDILTSVDTNWAIGALFLTVSKILFTIWFIVQAEIMKEIQDALTSVFFHNLFASILALGVGLVAETNRSLWKITLDISLISTVCTAIFGKFLGSAIYAWAIHLKGPVYVTLFKPLSIVIAVVMGILFLGDTLHVGSIIGATIISIGFYTVMWGKATEEKEDGFGSKESQPIENVPLLQDYQTVKS